MSLCFGFLYEKSSRFPLELRRRPVCKELKLVWFGDFKIVCWNLYSGIPGACLASVFGYIDDPMWGSEDGEGLSSSGILVCFVC